MAEQQAALEAERDARIAADEQLANEMASEMAQLRSDIAQLRTEFNAEIEAVAQGLQFAFPVHFGYNETEVRSTDYPALEAFASVVNAHYAGSLVTVEGFADPSGSAAYNRQLSQQRAESVRDRLVSGGLQAQIRTVGYGEERPVVPGAQGDEPGAELNRRVVFVIETPANAAPATTAQQPES
ncbi:MAG: OmpA family protein [Gemmatimonadota bacterium]